MLKRPLSTICLGNAAYSLVEVLVVVAVLGVLMTTAYPNFTNQYFRARQSEVKINLNMMKSAVQAYKLEKYTYKNFGDTAPGSDERIGFNSKSNDTNGLLPHGCPGVAGLPLQTISTLADAETVGFMPPNCVGTRYGYAFVGSTGVGESGAQSRNSVYPNCSERDRWELNMNTGKIHQVSGALMNAAGCN